MNKYANDWFSQLVEPYKSQALKSLEERFKRVKFNSLGSALAGTFDWEKSPEGQKYWNEFTMKVNKMEQDDLVNKFLKSAK
jgi:hypothetical protein